MFLEDCIKYIQYVDSNQELYLFMLVQPLIDKIDIRNNVLFPWHYCYHSKHDNISISKSYLSLSSSCQLFVASLQSAFADSIISVSSPVHIITAAVNTSADSNTFHSSPASNSSIELRIISPTNYSFVFCGVVSIVVESVFPLSFLTSQAYQSPVSLTTNRFVLCVYLAETSDFDRSEWYFPSRSNRGGGGFPDNIHQCFGIDYSSQAQHRQVVMQVLKSVCQTTVVKAVF
jgi:hypothetical protein